MKADIYRNLNFPGGTVIWSVRNRSTGLVEMRIGKVLVKHCSFVVNKSGRALAQKTGVKNVHAFVRGETTDLEPKGRWIRLRYNPWGPDGFATTGGRIIESAKFVRLDGTGCWAYGVKYRK